MSDPDCLDEIAGLAGTLAGERTIAGACSSVLRLGMRLTGARCAEVMFRAAGSRQMTCLAHEGAYPWCAGQSGGPRLGSRLVEANLQDRLPLYVGCIREDESLGFALPEGAELAQAAAIPLVVRGRVLGSLDFCGALDARFDQRTRDALEVVGGLLAPVIENLYLAEKAASEDVARRHFLVRELEASEDERHRIARELHDGLGQMLTGLVMNIDSAMALRAQPGKEEAAETSLKRSREAAASALRDIRRIILALRPTILDDMGLFPALETYARRTLEDAGISLRIKSNQPDARLSPTIENVVFRVLQEAINNVARHSGARQCRISMTISRTALTATVVDDGRGYDLPDEGDEPDHFGLKTMRERVAIIDGTLKLDSNPGSGSRVRVRVPIRTAAP